MAYRTFVDSDAAYWQVWDVQPTRIEQRRSDRRHAIASRWRGEERRMGGDRRLTSQKRIMLSSGFSEGWLTFESSTEKRRLTPIPSNWDSCPDAVLRSWCMRAKPIGKTRNNHVA